MVTCIGRLAAAPLSPSSRPGLCHLQRTIQILLSRLQPFYCDGLSFPFYIHLEDLAARLNYPKGSLIGPLKRSPVAITPDENKLGLAEVWWEGWMSSPVLGGGDWGKCTCLLTPAEEL